LNKKEGNKKEYYKVILGDYASLLLNENENPVWSSVDTLRRRAAVGR
jgi:hypothetical protein